MKHIFLTICSWLLISTALSAQKQLLKTYSAERIDNILLDANGVHSLKVMTSNTDDITLEVYVEGETHKDVVVHQKTEEGAMSLGFKKWPYATIYDDKLAAHKILSVEVTLTIPEDKFVSINSKTAAVSVSGSFEMLYVNIEDTSCRLQDYKGNAKITTHRGNVDVSVRDTNVHSEASSIYGTVQNELPPRGRHTIWVQSTHGDIRLQQTQ